MLTDDLDAATGGPTVHEVLVEPVRSRRERTRFIELPYRLHRDDAHFVPPLRSECRDLLNGDRNPFFAYGEAQLFVARRHGQVVGRIAAVHNPRHNQRHRASDGFFGQFECADDPEAAAALFDAAAQWLRDRGLRTLMGPVNFTTNDECGLLVDGFDQPARVLMPYNPSYYRPLLERCGLRKAKDLWTWEREIRPVERLESLAELVCRRYRLTVRDVDMGDLDAEVARIAHVYETAFQDNWGFVPPTEAELRLLARRLRRFADPRLIQLVEADGAPVAVTLMLPDLNQALPAARGRLTTGGAPVGTVRLLRAMKRIDRVRGVLIGIVPGYRGRGLEAVLGVRMYRALLAGGYTGAVEFGWTLEDNQAVNQFLAGIGCTRAKTYRIYRRDL